MFFEYNVNRYYKEPQEVIPDQLLQDQQSFFDVVFSKPNRGILIVNRWQTHRKFATPELQLYMNDLTDFEIRDLFTKKNNLILYCIDDIKSYPYTTVNPSCEWVNMEGPYGYTKISPLTRSPAIAQKMIKKLVLNSTPYDTIWIIELDMRTNTWYTIYSYPASIVRQSMVISRYPYFLKSE